MPFTVETMVAGRKLQIETGRLAKQADGAVFVRYGDTVVLTAAVSEKVAKPDMGFFPLTVEYRERPTPQAGSPVDSSSARAGPARPRSSPPG